MWSDSLQDTLCVWCFLCCWCLDICRKWPEQCQRPFGNPMESHRNFSNWLLKNQEEFWYSYHTGDHDQLQSYTRCVDTAGRLCERAALLGCKGVWYQPTPWPKKCRCRCHLHLMNSIETLWPHYTARFIIHFCVHVPSLSYQLCKNRCKYSS